MNEQQPAAKDQWIELKQGVPFVSSQELNRIARQQGLCLAIAQAAVYDEICQAVDLPKNDVDQLTQMYLSEQGITDQDQLQPFLNSKGWTEDDLIYFATKGHCVSVFQTQAFTEEVELRFLNRKLDLDQVTYSLIRISNGDLAFELHQQLLEGEASFEELATEYSEGSEQQSGGLQGPYPLSQANETVAEKLRVSQPGQLWPPFFLKDIWVILRLEHWEGARLNDDGKEAMLDELFGEWFKNRVMQYLNGETPGPLPIRSY